jgi:hypothetical protein
VNKSVLHEDHILTDEVWARHCSKTERMSNSAVRPDKSKSMSAAIVDNEKSFERMTTGDGKNVLELLRSL